MVVKVPNGKEVEFREFQRHLPGVDDPERVQLCLRDMILKEHGYACSALRTGQLELLNFSSIIPMPPDRDSLHEAITLHRSGLLSEADAAYGAVLDREPRNARALRLRGILAREQGDSELSLRLLRKAVEIAPADGESAAELGLGYLAAGYLQLAEEAFRRALSRDPDSIKALANLGAVLQYRGHLAAAIACYQQVLARDPDDPETAANLAATLADAGHDAEALRVLAAPAPDDPGDPTLLATRGAVLLALEQPGEALPLLESAVQAAPRDDLLLINLALARQSNGDAAGARRALVAALRTNPDNARATADLAGLCLIAGEADEAVDLCANFLARHPGERLVLAAQGFALREAGQGEAADGLVDLERLVRIRELPVRGAGDAGAFNAGVTRVILADPSLATAPRSKATRGGRQTGEFSPDRDPALTPFRDALRVAVKDVTAVWRREGFAGHPALAWESPEYTLRIWATVLAPGGYQLPHIHPLAWLSGVYYVALPSGMGGADPAAGALEFGQPPERLRGRVAAPLRRVTPAEGRLVLFPSYLHHRTIPHAAPGERLSIAFDVVPLRPSGRPVRR